MKDKKQPLLSICIPTWNRAKYLKQSLESIREQFWTLPKDTLELLVSDNCSTDSTAKIVDSFIQDGIPIRYNRNEKNIGGDGNFLKCMNLATGKYIFLLGDDDILLPGSIKYLLSVLEKEDWGVLHISLGKDDKHLGVYDSRNDFLKNIGFEITFMSSNIFRRDAVPLVENPERYFKSFFMQIPFYIKSALSCEKNIIVNEPILNIGLDGEANGGYNLYEVFVRSYLNIWYEFVETKEIPMSVYRYIRKDMLMNFLLGYNYCLLFLHRNVKNGKDKDGRGGFAIDNAWKILFGHYGKCWYFYYSLLLMLNMGMKGLVRRCFKALKYK